MIRQFLVPLLALCGIGLALFTVLSGRREPPTAQPVVEPAKAPYETFVAGSGIVESRTENIAIGTHIAGIVSEVVVVVGSLVKAGDPLFKIDDRSPVAQAGVRRAEVQVADFTGERQEPAHSC